MKKIALSFTLLLAVFTSFAQYTQLTDFTGNGAFIGSTPKYDQNLISDGTFLYGMTAYGGTNNKGTLFKILPDGTGFTKLQDFAGVTNGSNPYGSLISDGIFLYGMTQYGGTNNLGTLFKILPDGTSFTKLLDFDGAASGRQPYGSLISDGTFLYGMTQYGGTNDLGTIFKIKPDGTSFTKLLDFAGATNGKNPYGSLISDGTFLYGMTYSGGTNDLGTLFKILSDGTGFTKLLDFAGVTNGNYPFGSLISDGTFLYGMTCKGGAKNGGTLFKIAHDGTGFAKLQDFVGDINGSNPQGSLVSDGTFLYGMTQYGGTNEIGTLFKILPDGTSFTKLLDFDGAASGRQPYGSLISDGTFLYGMTKQGGTNNMGVIFKIKPDGTNFTKLLDFAGASNGKNPYGSLIFDGIFLYGMTFAGGTNDVGTLFKILPDGTGFAKLQDFAVTTNGSYPFGSLISDGTFLYGITRSGGTNSYGTLFKIKPDGTSFAKLLDFAGATNGGYPYGSLISDGTFLYGMTQYGGTNNKGTLFKILPDGTNFSKLVDFAGVTNGSSPFGSLIFDGTFLYGMTQNGGTNDVGTIFKIKPDGTGIAKLQDFAGATNGRSPYGSLVSNGTFLYGMTSQGGTNNMGATFKIKPDGTGYTKLLDFTGTTNGRYPQGSLISDGTFLYGMTQLGGTNNLGTLFKILPDGTGFTKLLDFAGTTNGSFPYGSLVADGTFLYGMTQRGGTNSMGVIFKILPDGTGYTKLLDFTGTTN